MKKPRQNAVVKIVNSGSWDDNMDLTMKDRNRFYFLGEIPNKTNQCLIVGYFTHNIYTLAPSRIVELTPEEIEKL